MDFASRLTRSPDPYDPARGAEALAAYPDVAASVAQLIRGTAGCSPYLAGLMTREGEWIEAALQGTPEAAFEDALAGLGDLVLTCTGDLSRNRKVGIELSSGKSIAEITGSMRMVAEGVETVESAVALGRKFGVDLPITSQMHALLHGQKSPREALRDLMERSLKGE